MEQHPHYKEGWDRSTIIFLIVAHLLAVASLWFFSLEGLFLAILLYIASAMGVTVGYHRLLTHESFVVPWYLRRMFAVAGLLSGEGPPLFWVAWHRMHHKYSDTENDPHSPHHGGFLHAHVLWTLAFTGSDRYALLYRTFAKKLLKEENDGPFMLWLNRTYIWWHLGLLVLLLAGGYAYGALVHGTGWWYMLSFAGYAGLVRLVFVLHCTWLVNSLSHIQGEQPHAEEAGDLSRNNWLVAMLTFGEGWHNNHHACPTGYRHGVGPWQIDLSACLIETLAAIGLASNLKEWELKAIKKEEELEPEPIID